MKKIYILSLVLIASFSIRSAAETIDVTQSGTSFAPLFVELNVGDVIHFQWTGGSHNTTSVSVPEGADPWASPLNSGMSSFNYTVEVAGDYAYICTFHNGMGGAFSASPAAQVEPVVTAASDFSVGLDATNHSLHIKLTNYGSGHTTMKMIDITGKNVAVLFDGQVSTGEQNIRYEAAQHPSGVYFIRMEQNGKAVTKKVMLN